MTTQKSSHRYFWLVLSLLFCVYPSSCLTATEQVESSTSVGECLLNPVKC